MRAITDTEAAAASGVAHAAVLLDFADAATGEDEAALAGVRERVLGAVGPAGLVDAAAVVANFERMVRIADSTGIPLDAPIHLLAGDLQADLGLTRFGSARNTPEPEGASRLLAALIRPVAQRALPLAARLMKRRFRGR